MSGIILMAFDAQSFTETQSSLDLCLCYARCSILKGDVIL